jgi:hypothetical protein
LRLLEDHGAVLIGMLAENDAETPLAHEPSQLLLAISQGQVPEVFAVELQ